MSPEQLKGQPLDQRCDVFALGAVLYEMLSGKEAFPGETAAEVIAAVVSSGPTPRIEPPGPGALNAILDRALAAKRRAATRRRRPSSPTCARRPRASGS
jgi:serine/threonine-protein kinase